MLTLINLQKGVPCSFPPTFCAHRHFLPAEACAAAASSGAFARFVRIALQSAGLAAIWLLSDMLLFFIPAAVAAVQYGGLFREDG